MSALISWLRTTGGWAMGSEGRNSHLLSTRLSHNKGPSGYIKVCSLYGFCQWLKSPETFPKAPSPCVPGAARTRHSKDKRLQLVLQHAATSTKQCARKANGFSAKSKGHRSLEVQTATGNKMLETTSGWI